MEAPELRLLAVESKWAIFLTESMMLSTILKTGQLFWNGGRISVMRINLNPVMSRYCGVKYEK